MSNKGFISILVAALVVGGVLGGTFFGGVAVGKGQSDDTDIVSLAAPQQTTPAQQSRTGTESQTLDQLRTRTQSGDVTPEDLAQLRQRFLGQFGGRDSGGSFGGRGGLTGTVESISGSKIVLETIQGTIEAAVGEDVTVRITQDVPISDLAAGMRVAINGERREDGVFHASTVTVIPERADGSPFEGRNHRGDQGLDGGTRDGWRLP